MYVHTHAQAQDSSLIKVHETITQEIIRLIMRVNGARAAEQLEQLKMEEVRRVKASRSLISRYPVEVSFRFNEADSPNDHDVAGDDCVPYGFTFRPLARSVIVVKGEGSVVGLALSG